MLRNRLLVSGVAAASFLAGSLVSTAFTQSQAPPLVIDVAFMKVEPGKAQDYLRLESELWKPVHQERIRRGHMKSWSLFRVEYPHGADQEYNFVTVNVYNSLVDIDRDVIEVFSKVHPSIKTSDVVSRTFGARRLARGEMWRRLDHVE
jgi:hypothetical protein